MNVEGTVISIGLAKNVTQSFTTRTIVIETDGQYPQKVEFQAVNNTCYDLDAFTEGDMVNLFFNLRGREWTSPVGEVKYFNTLQIWKIERVNEFGNLKNKNTFAENKGTGSGKHWSGLSGDIATSQIDNALDNVYAADNPFK
jgi:hypothetical protein